MKILAILVWRVRIKVFFVTFFLPFNKSFRNTRLDSEWNTTFWVVPAEDFQ